MAVGPIPWDKIEHWCASHGLDREATEVMVAVIMKLDGDRAEREESKRRLEQLQNGGR